MKWLSISWHNAYRPVLKVTTVHVICKNQFMNLTNGKANPVRKPPRGNSAFSSGLAQLRRSRRTSAHSAHWSRNEKRCVFCINAFVRFWRYVENPMPGSFPKVYKTQTPKPDFSELFSSQQSTFEPNFFGNCGGMWMWWIILRFRRNKAVYASDLMKSLDLSSFLVRWWKLFPRWSDHCGYQSEVALWPNTKMHWSM